MMHWPQYVILAGMMLRLGYYLAVHGQERKMTMDFWCMAIVTAGYAAILYAGGFWGHT